MSNILRQKEFAARVGVTPGAINEAVRRPALRDAVVVARPPSGTKKKITMIDADHPAALRYAETQAQRRATTGVTAPSIPKPPAVTPYVPATGQPVGALPSHDPNADIKDYMDWSLARIVATFGTGERFVEWLRATKILVEIHAKNLDALTKEEKTIGRDLVRQHIFGAMNDCNQRLLIDAPKTIARRIDAHAKSDGTIEDAERIIREIISKQLRNMQSTALRLLAVQIDDDDRAGNA